RLPSGPAAMASGPASGVGMENSVMAPAGVIRPILSASNSVNHTFQSGPGAMPLGPLSGVGVANSVTAPDGVMRATLDAAFSVNHRLPSGPAAMAAGLLLGVGMGKMVMPAARAVGGRLTAHQARTS